MQRAKGINVVQQIFAIKGPTVACNMLQTLFVQRKMPTTGSGGMLCDWEGTGKAQRIYIAAFFKPHRLIAQ
jgi:hypothetical protein